MYKVKVIGDVAKTFQEIQNFKIDSVIHRLACEKETKTTNLQNYVVILVIIFLCIYTMLAS